MADEVKDDIDLSPETSEDSGTDPFEALENDTTSWDDGVDDSEETEEPEAESEQEPESQEEESESDEEDTDSTDTQEETETTDSKTKEQLAQESFKRREAERKLREAEQKREAENLQRYLDEAKEDEDLLRERQLEVDAYYLTKQRSEVLERSLEVDIKQAVADLELKSMDDATRDYVARRLDEFEATRVIRDKNGNLLQVNGNVYQYLKEELDSISRFKGIGAREQTKKKTVEKSITVPKSSRTPKEPKVDADLEAFKKEFGL